MNTVLPGGVYIVPMAIVPTTGAAFFDGRTALFVATTSVILTAPYTSFVLEFIYLQVCAIGWPYCQPARLSRQLTQIVEARRLWWLWPTMLGYLSLRTALMNGSAQRLTWRMPAFLGANALLVSMAYILMFAVERLFGFVSSVTLVELSDTNRLAAQAPLRQLSRHIPTLR